MSVPLSYLVCFENFERMMKKCIDVLRFQVGRERDGFDLSLDAFTCYLLRFYFWEEGGEDDS